MQRNAIMGRPMRRAAQYYPDGFKDVDEVVAFVNERYFKDAKPGEPFMLVTRFVDERLVRHVFGRGGEYEDSLETCCYLGTIGQKLPFAYSTSEEKMWYYLALRSSVYVQIAGELKIVRKALPIEHTKIGKTPLKEPFDPPSPIFSSDATGLRKKIDAFSFAVGFEEMEKLCVAENNWLNQLCVGYIRAAKLLSFPLVTKPMLEAKAARKQEILQDLSEAHRAQKKDKVAHLLDLARELDMQEDAEPISINGIRHFPKFYLEDLATLYSSG